MYFLSVFRRGLFVKYRKGMPLPEMVFKDIRYFFKWTVNLICSGLNTRTIFVYPHYPSSGSTLYKVADKLRYNLTNKINFAKNADIIVYWEYLTFRKEFELLEQISDQKVINLLSRDISKVFVDRAFRKVFGYSTFIDPVTYDKPYVKKNDINACHDGEIILHKVDSPETGYIYQKLIDNSADDNTVLDFRVPVVDGTIGFIYLKYRNKKIRFTNSTERTIVKPIEDIFSENEIHLINKFCREIHLEYGELDVLRDNDDKKIYIVDVNNTPQGPPANLDKRAAKQAIGKIAEAFKTKFLQNV
jgi:hypothetical protein